VDPRHARRDRPDPGDRRDACRSPEVEDEERAGVASRFARHLGGRSWLTAHVSVLPFWNATSAVNPLGSKAAIRPWYQLPSGAIAHTEAPTAKYVAA
jgi:hypothetical protein